MQFDFSNVTIFHSCVSILFYLITLQVIIILKRNNANNNKKRCYYLFKNLIHRHAGKNIIGDFNEDQTESFFIRCFKLLKN